MAIRIGVGDYETNDLIRTNMKEVLDSGRLSYGKFTRECEEQWSALHGTEFAIAVSSGTAALHTSILALGELREWTKGQSTIIVPAVTFVATLNTVVHAGYVPVLVDVRREDGLIDVDQIEEAIDENTVAIIPVHLFGNPAHMAQIMEIAEKYNLDVIEDSAEAVLASENGSMVGSMGDIGCFSTYIAHHVPSGSGGFITTNAADLHDICRSIVNHGRDIRYFNPDMQRARAGEYQFLFHRAGLNYRTTELVSAVTAGLLPDIEDIILRRRAIASYYTRKLGDAWGIVRERTDTCHSWMMFPIRPPWIRTRQDKMHLMQYLYFKGIDTRECLPLTNQPYINWIYGNQRNFPIADEWNQTGLYLPCHQYMTDGDMEYITKSLEGYLDQS